MILRAIDKALDLGVDLPNGPFLEGVTIPVTVRATAERDLAVGDGVVELVRTVCYRYREGNMYGAMHTATTRRAEVVSRAVLPAAGPLGGGESVVHHVPLLVPNDGLGTVHAGLLDVEWAVRARLHVHGARDSVRETPLIVVSEARGCASVAETLPVLEDRGFAVLEFEKLSTRRFVPGAEMSGVLVMTALRSGSVRGVRAELVLLEHVEHGPWIGDDPARNPSDQAMTPRPWSPGSRWRSTSSCSRDSGCSSRSPWSSRSLYPLRRSGHRSSLRVGCSVVLPTGGSTRTPRWSSSCTA